MPNDREDSLLRTIAWYMAIGYPPLREEIWQDVEEKKEVSRHEYETTLDYLIANKRVILEHGRVILPGFEALLPERARRARVFPRKWARVQQVAWWLRWIPSVRFVAIGNTVALGSSRDEGDIDLFVVTRSGTLWLTRGLLTLVATLLRRRPGQRNGERDAWCFSFFIDESSLDLERFAIQPRDPYLAFWIRHLVPVLDDGIGTELWNHQSWAWNHRPWARRWLSWRTTGSRANPVPAWLSSIDRMAFHAQKRFGSRALWQAAERQNTHVVLTPNICKTHLDDRREVLRSQYEKLCTSLGITS